MQKETAQPALGENKEIGILMLQGFKEQSENQIEAIKLYLKLKL